MTTDPQPKAKEADYGKTITEFRDAMQAVEERTKGLDPEKMPSKEAVEGLKTQLMSLESANQGLVKQEAEAKATVTDLTERLDVFEKQVKRFSSHSDGYSERKQVIKSVQDMMLNINHKTLATDDNIQAGFLKTPPEFVLEIDKDITEITPIFSIVRVRQTSSGEVKLPRRTRLLTTNAVGERQTIPQNESDFGMVTIKVHKQASRQHVTQEMLDDAAFDLEREMLSDVTEDFSRIIGAQVVNGSGVNEARGFLNNTDILATGVINTGGAGTIPTGDSIIRLIGTLKDGYNPMFLVNRQVLAEIWLIKGTDDHYIFNHGDFAAGTTNQLRGIPYVLSPDMPTLAADALILALGDFKRGYTFVQNTDIRIKRDDFTLSDQDIVKFIFTRRYGGDVLRPEAIKLLKAAV